MVAEELGGWLRQEREERGWTRAEMAWLGVAFLVLGGATLAWAARRWYVGQKVRAERGTAYVIEEQAVAWRHEEKQWVLDQLVGGFARVMRVPGPEALGERWRWQADAQGASLWDRRTDQLVHSFWAVHYNDDQVTRNAVFVWAPWPVSMAFGARATARRRGLVLHVRKRPSSGAGGQRHALRLTDPAHDFLRDPAQSAAAAQAPERLYPLHFTGGRLLVPELDLGRNSVPPERV